MHEIMTIEEVAAYLRVSERTVYDWAQKGDLPGGKLGTTWRFKRNDVENWVNSRLSSGSGTFITLGRTVAICGRWLDERIVAMIFPPKAGLV